MRERDLLNHIYQRSRSLAGRFGIVVPPGDDCAAIQTGAGIQLLTVDQLIEGRHFDSSATPERIAHKAIARSVSDIAAMGGTPTVALATAAMMPGDSRMEPIFNAMHEAALNMGCPLVGGDIAMYDMELHEDAPAVFTVTVVGSAHSIIGPVLRSGAKPGDGVYVTGKIGCSFRSDHHLIFTPRVREAKELCDQLGDALHSMIDISDGLGIDAGRIAEASDVAIQLDAASIPAIDTQEVPLLHLIGYGEDYELLFTAVDRAMERARFDFPVTRIGTVRSPLQKLLDAGEVELRFSRYSSTKVHTHGWDHGATDQDPLDIIFD